MISSHFVKPKSQRSSRLIFSPGDGGCHHIVPSGNRLYRECGSGMGDVPVPADSRLSCVNCSGTSNDIFGVPELNLHARNVTASH